MFQKYATQKVLLYRSFIYDTVRLQNFSHFLNYLIMEYKFDLIAFHTNFLKLNYIK